MPFLFGSIGAAVDLSLIKPNYIVTSFIVVMLGECARWAAVVLITCGGKFTMKERMFMGFAWTPKATV